jgi:uridine kinase
MKLIAISGCSGAGKSYFAERIKEIGKEQELEVSILGLDCFMLDRETRTKLGIHHGYSTRTYNMDSLHETLEKLIIYNQEVKVHEYNHATGKHFEDFNIIKPSDYLVLDSVMSLQNEIYDRYCPQGIFLDVDYKHLIPLKIFMNLHRNKTKYFSLVGDAKIHKTGYIEHCEPTRDNAEYIFRLDSFKNGRQYKTIKMPERIDKLLERGIKWLTR